jgi:hypothetical protein
MDRASVASCLIAILVAGCSSKLISTTVEDFPTSGDVGGVPWIESTMYDVKVYSVEPDAIGQKVLVNQLKFERQMLTDKINGQDLGGNSRKWVVNYVGQVFSTANVKVEFFDNASLKSVRSTASTSAPEAAEAAATAINLQDEIEQRELERLERRKRIKETEEALRGLD